MSHAGVRKLGLVTESDFVYVTLPLQFFSFLIPMRKLEMIILEIFTSSKISQTTFSCLEWCYKTVFIEIN